MTHVEHVRIERVVDKRLHVNIISSEDANEIALKFFHYFNFAKITSTNLRKGIWRVQATTFSYGIPSTRILAIDSKTGGIISCE